MFQRKNLLSILAFVLFTLFFVTACGKSPSTETPQSKETGHENENEQENVELVVNEENDQLTKEGKAFKALLKSRGLSYDANEINEIAKNGQITVDNEYTLISLDPTTINNKEFLRFEQVSTGGKGASSIYLVSAEKDTVYSGIDGTILKEFNLSNLESEQLFNRDIYILTEKSPHSTNTIYIDGETNKVYYDLDTANREILAEATKNDLLLSLVGKDSSFVQSKTGKAVQKEMQEVVDDFGDVFNMELKYIDYNKARIYFNEDDSFSLIQLNNEANFLGAKPGMTFSEIKKILGKPDSEYQDPGWGDYLLIYNIDNKNITFYANSASGPSTAISIQ